MTKFALVGDVGGTNARLALCDIASGDISRAKTYSGLDYPSLEAVVRVYLDEQGVEVEDGCIAIACPITGDWVAMTNHTWAFSIAEMKKNLGFSHLEIINDFTAVSMAIPMLKAEHLIQFGGRGKTYRRLRRRNRPGRCASGACRQTLGESAGGRGAR